MKTRLQQVSEEYTKTTPKSVCKCGHLGDGANSHHEDTAFEAGHGPCRDPGCDCGRFSWRGFTSAFQAVLDEAMKPTE